MRLAVYGLAAVLLSAAPALAQQSPQTQGAWTPPRSALSSAMPTFSDDTALQTAIAAETRPAADRARDVYRHPYESLTFWGLTPGMTVVEIEPGGASWWRHILEPYAAATGITRRAGRTRGSARPATGPGGPRPPPAVPRGPRSRPGPG